MILDIYDNAKTDDASHTCAVAHHVDSQSTVINPAHLGLRSVIIHRSDLVVGHDGQDDGIV